MSGWAKLFLFALIDEDAAVRCWRGVLGERDVDEGQQKGEEGGDGGHNERVNDQGVERREGGKEVRKVGKKV